ncbi:MAG: NifU family protein [Nitrospiria bacterium]
MNREKPAEKPLIATLTDGAVEKVREALQGENYEGIRMTVSRRGGEFVYTFDYVEKGKADPHDFDLPCGTYRFYINRESEELIKGSVIDYVRAGFTQAWVIDNPNPAWDSEMAREISKILDEVINPGVAEHGGHIHLVDLKENIVYVEMSGGCQGCGMANKTLRHGVMKILSEKFPQITDLIDVTDHSAGTNPFFNNEKGSIPTFKS